MPLDFIPIPESKPSVLARLARASFCSAIDGNDFPNWEKVLKDPSRHPKNWMRTQRQTWNDCQGQATANGVEKREGYVLKGKCKQRSDSYAYAACEYLDAGRVGANRGTSITSGIILQTEGIKKLGVKPGLPLEKDWKYERRTNTRKFIADAKAVDLQQSFISEQQAMPDFESTLIAMAAGGSGHIGIHWSGIRWKKTGRKREMIARGRSGGHAVEGVWAEWIDRQWKLNIWNSHGDSFFYIGEAMWNRLVDIQFRPFGGFLLMPDKAPERFDLATWKRRLKA